MIHFMNPLFFLLALFIAAVVFFYFFRKQYKENVIPSNLLWQEVMNEWQASPFLKKLQQNLLFWLQILVLLLLMLALVHPIWYEERLKGEHIVFIVDTSATMSATDGEQSRFEEAKKEMRELAKTLKGQEFTLIEAGQKSEIRLSREDNKRTVLQGIDALELSYGHENMEQVFNLAESVATQDETSIYVFSDHVTKDMLNDQDRYVEVHNFGKKLGNVSLTSFGVGNVNGKINGVAVIDNQSSAAKKVTLTISGNEKSLYTKEILLKDKSSFVLTVPELPRSPYYEAAIAIEDGYTADNKITAVYTDPSPSIYVAGEVNPFVIKGFETIGVDLLQGKADSRIDENAIVIMEGSELKSLPDRPVILFNLNEKIKLAEQPSNTEDPLLEYVHAEDMYIQYRSSELGGSGLDTILTSGNHPLIQKGIYNGQPLIVMNFSLSDSDWPLHPDFPIFLYNSYQWLAHQTGFLGYFNPGEEKWLNAYSRGTSLEIYDNQDENLFSIDPEKEAMKAPVQPGTYQAVADEEIYYFSVLLDDREKRPEAAASFTLNEQKGGEKSAGKQPNESLILTFSLIAFLLMMIEWEVYRRGFRA
nr:BatA and WFA domain-containing protein [uncultured Bacillus sp.]